MTDEMREIFQFLKEEKMNAGMDGQRYREHMFEKIEEALMEIGNAYADYASRVVFLLDTFNLWPEGHFTFPDGDTWTNEDRINYD